MIEALHLTRRFGPFTAVDDLSFSIEKGEVVGFLGANGAGKTTTMRMLTGYLPPTSGTVRVGGLDIVRDSLEVRRRIGYLPESVPLYGEHRVEEMLAFQGRLHGLDAERIRARTEEVLQRVGLAERRRSLISSLSKGMRQRVGLAVAILSDPEVLILDEPTSGLDPLQRVEVRGLIREIARERTVLVSSHILPEVEAVADRIVILHRGRIAAQGTRAELVDQRAGGSSVRVEAFVRDPVEAARLLRALPGVSQVNDTGRLGIHHGFDVLCGGDLREDVGALAAAKGWALRELSFKRPSLEELFARIALELETPASAPQAPASEAPAPVLISSLPLAGPAAPPKRQVYNLNPFELGGQRDLSAPKDPDAR
jgi:ABC-2 type transport system ATP-binding protein